VARDAVYTAHYASFGGKLSRLELDIALEGANAQAHLSGVSVLHGDSHADITTRLSHAVGNTQSTQLFKKVAGGKSRAVYQGKVTVTQGANGSDSRQTAKALLLGNQAEADLKPELEIFADDVKCAHGAAVGDLDADSLFYLRARGIPESDARDLLIHAFLEDAMAGIARDDLRDQVRTAVNEALAS
jgi:Fe-S cluster assembly protein SufD